MKSEYLLQALSANLDLVEIITLSSFAYLLTRKDDGSRKRLIIYLLILLRYLLPVGLRFAKESIKDSEGKSMLCDTCLLGAKAIFTLGFYLSSKWLN